MPNKTSPISSTSPRLPNTSRSSATITVTIFIILAACLVAGIIYFRRTSPNPANVASDKVMTDSNEILPVINQPPILPPDDNTIPIEPQTTMEPTTDPVMVASTLPTTVQEFIITGQNFRYSPSELRVKQGDTVRIVFNSLDMMHDWRLDEFDATTQIIPAGQTDTIEFVASRPGTFEFYCSVGQHRQNGMVGSLIVE